ncbi:MAG: GIY-YIG nuclease family protein [Bacteroidetes bacterium]|nr:GIY-YIG nuclease family protein [Bacteroidota bacterium]
MYAIVDIETTGGMARHERITEIAIFLFDGHAIINELVTLINPERPIPYHITALTGITNEMVAEAPKFYEIAKQIIEITDKATFVAHNVSFDYGFIKQEFKNLGYTYRRPKLCTVKLSRQIIPGHPSYSLGNLCKSLNITLNDRHRAAGDALATVELFKLLLKTNQQQHKIDFEAGFSIRGLHPQLNKQELLQLPEEAGVYYFFDEQDQLIYIGKSINIQKRVISHLSNEKSRRSIDMKSAIAKIDYERTGSELVALLLESDEIKKHKPKFNRAQRRNGTNYGIYYKHNSENYICFSILKNAEQEDIPLTTFNSQREARETLYKWTEAYKLCQKLCGLYHSAGACFYYGLKECYGACCGAESPDDYNIRAQKLIDKLSFQSQNFYIVENGRDIDEKAIVKVLNGKYFGFGYVHNDFLSHNYMNGLDDCIKSYPDTRDTRIILKSYLQSKNPQVIGF